MDTCNSDTLAEVFRRTLGEQAKETPVIVSNPLLEGHVSFLISEGLKKIILPLYYSFPLDAVLSNSLLCEQFFLYRVRQLHVCV